jgi:hypothetical protein
VVALISTHVVRRLRDPAIILLTHDGPAQWLRVDADGSLVARKPGEYRAIFRTRVNGGASGTSAELTVRALRRVVVLLNGQQVFDSGPDLTEWKEPRRVPLELPADESELALFTTNDMGPPMALARSDALSVASDAKWEASADDGKTWAPAATADAPMRFPGPSIAPRPADALVTCLPWLLPAALFGAFWGWRDPTWITPSRVRWALLAAWALLAINNLPKLPVRMGFDMVAHLQYMDFIARQHRLPLATDGWQMFQSPLYYVISAPIFAALNGQVSNAMLMGMLRLIPMACGAAQVEWCRLSAGYAFPGRRQLQCLAILFGGLLPMTLYISQSTGNEPLSGCLGALAIVLTLRYARRTLARTDRSAATAGGVVGLALLAKVSALLIVPVQLWVIAIRRRGGRRAALAAIACAIICGWYYARNLIAFGKPFVAGWDPGRLPWWQDPGYRSIGSMTRFGRTFVDPVYAGLNGFWDALYSTFWADGFLSGIAKESAKPPWNYTLMSAGIVLFLLPSLAMIVGFVRAWRDPILRIAAVLAAVHLLALADLYFQVPVYSTVKATYLLALVPAVAILFAAGIEPMMRWRTARTVVFAYTMVCTITSYATYFVVVAR